MLALRKRPVSTDQVDAAVDRIKEKLLGTGAREIPSARLGELVMRELKRIPVFNPDLLTGWGITNESKAVMGTRPDGHLRYNVADTHHLHASYKDGNYDGRYAWVNDKINARLARIRLDYFICDKITDLPNVQGFHGIFPDKADPVDPAITHTTRVFAGLVVSVMIVMGSLTYAVANIQAFA